MDSMKQTLADMPVTRLKGVGPRGAERLARLGIETVMDLLFHLPLRYQDRSRLTPLSCLRHGDEVLVEGVIEETRIQFGRRRSMLVYVHDEQGNGVALRFFHFSAAQKNAFARGKRLRCFGEVRQGPAGFEMVHPEYRFCGEQPEPVESTLTPIYPTTEGLHQLSWRDLTDKALDLLAQSDERLPDWMPAELLGDDLNMPLAEALRILHRPPVETSHEQLETGQHPAQQRLAFEELVAHQLSMRQARQLQRRIQAPELRDSAGLGQRLLQRLPFALTTAQQRVVREISTDLESATPMLRMVQGDVGSGKTVVAALAALQAVGAGYQVALMAPTELLAEQHFRLFRDWLHPELALVGLLTGRVKGKARKSLLEALQTGEMSILIGTQALFQQEVQYARLGLVIIDEQHRFGVHQRLALKEKAGRQRAPHQLIMSATPIPRSLAMTAYADLDLSVIDELPPGRTPVHTVVLSDARREEVMQRLHQACSAGRQAYWVCTLIEESELLQCQAAEQTARELGEALSGLRVGLVHGRMSAAEKEQVMGRFKQGELDLLVATTVIEVGMDVPNASLMIIENPERLGLSQLHQLRGRVGRGSAVSHCLLMYHPPLGRQGRERLATLRETTDGFVIAQKDLELRGPGEVLGVRQTGEMHFRIADLVRDQALVERAQQAADRLLQTYPQAVGPLVRRWLGERQRFVQV